MKQDRVKSHPVLLAEENNKGTLEMEYDEIRITTRREINICEGAIKQLEKLITAMEEKYGKDSEVLFRDVDDSVNPASNDFIHWRESVQALARWKERLAAHQGIMHM